jgi:hypothetical protein
MAEAAIMKTIHLLVGSVFSGLVLALLAAEAQEAPTAAKQGKAGPVTVERDKEKEDHVAKLFEGIRADAGLPLLKRIRHRADLEQGVCTSALTGEMLKRWGSYTTADPGSITPELKKIASSNRLGPDKRPRYARYSVAVWRVKDPNGEEVAYRVGVGFYGTALGEFVDCHFTDDVYYCGNWKAAITRPCRGK